MPGWDPCPSPSGEALGGSFQLLAVLTAPTCIPRLVGLGHLSQKGERIPKVLLQLQSHIMFRGAAEAVSQGAVMALAPLLGWHPGLCLPFSGWALALPVLWGIAPVAGPAGVGAADPHISGHQ